MKFLLPFLFCFTASAQLALNNAFYNKFLIQNTMIDYGYFMEEDFEGPGYQNVWTQAGAGTINDQYDTAPAPLQGLYSLRIQIAGTSRRTTNEFDLDHSTVYGFMLINFLDFPNDREFIGFWNDGVELLSIGVDGGGRLTLIDAGGKRATTAAGGFEDTTYYVWFRYTKGTGANATYEVQYSTTPTKPPFGGLTASFSGGSSTLDVNRFVIGATAGAANYQIITDKIRMSETDIGSNPD